MKIKSLLTLASGLLLATSCSKDSQEVPVAPSNPEVRSVYMDLSAGPEEGDLRLAQVVDAEGRALNPFMEEKNLEVRIAVRRGEGTPVYQTLTFTKQAGQLYARYSGQVNIPATGTGDYSIAGIVLNEVSGTTFTTLSGDKVQAVPATGLIKATTIGTLSVVRSKIPYVAHWLPISLTLDGKRIDTPVVMNFKPSGTLLRMRIENTLTDTHTVKAIQVRTNAFYKAWEYDFTQLVGASSLVHGQFISPATASTWTETFSLPGGNVALSAAQKSDFYYIWVMPHVNATTLQTDINVVTVGASGDEYYSAFSSTGFLRTGAVPVELKLRGSNVGANFGRMPNQNTWQEIGPITTGINSFPLQKLPHTYFAGLAKADQSGVIPVTSTTANNDSQIGFFTIDEATSLSIPGYRVPDSGELRSIFPAGNYNRSTTDIATAEETIVVGGQEYLLEAEYKSSNNVLYGLRFKGEDGLKRMAFRYEWIGTFAPNDTNSKLKVTMKFVGTDDRVNMDYIINTPDFWTSDVHELYFPAAGMRQGTSAGAAVRLGEYGFYWAYRYDTLSTAWNSHFTGTGLRGNWGNTANALPIYLIKQ